MSYPARAEWLINMDSCLSQECKVKYKQPHPGIFFFKVAPLIFNRLIPVSFPLVEAPLKILPGYRVRLNHWVHLMSSIARNLTLEINFLLRKNKSRTKDLGSFIRIENAALAQTHVLSKCYIAMKWLHEMDI